MATKKKAKKASIKKIALPENGADVQTDDDAQAVNSSAASAGGAHLQPHNGPGDPRNSGH